MRLKLTEMFCVMEIKNDAKFGEELTCLFKIDMKSLKNLCFNGLFLTKANNFLAKKVKKNYV